MRTFGSSQPANHVHDFFIPTAPGTTINGGNGCSRMRFQVKATSWVEFRQSRCRIPEESLPIASLRMTLIRPLQLDCMTLTLTRQPNNRGQG